jgi:hypothetical protein
MLLMRIPVLVGRVLHLMMLRVLLLMVLMLVRMLMLRMLLMRLSMGMVRAAVGVVTPVLGRSGLRPRSLMRVSCAALRLFRHRGRSVCI